MANPWRRKTRRIPRSVIPMDFRIPISEVRSTTTMTRVLTMLKAATTTMRKRMIPMASFSSWRAAKRDWFVVIQLST
jgi:hypothetical protein